jgi:hypothetical protein
METQVELQKSPNYEIEIALDALEKIREFFSEMTKRLLVDFTSLCV